jgi:hypothetical protein
VTEEKKNSKEKNTLEKKAQKKLETMKWQERQQRLGKEDKQSK